MIEQKNVSEKIKIIMAGVANDLRNALVKNAPVDTGRLKNSIRVEGSDKGLELSMVEYGANVEFGTAPHIIRPKNKKALYWKGAEHPVKQVKHPGTRPNPFIRTTVTKELKKIVIDNMKRHS